MDLCIVGTILLFAFLTEKDSFTSYGTFGYLLLAQICNINLRVYITIVRSRRVGPKLYTISIEFWPNSMRPIIVYLKPGSKNQILFPYACPEKTAMKVG